MSKGYYHVCSHGLEKNDIFKTHEEFVQGMNDVAICVLGFDVIILAFCLMSNHFHFVLYGTLEDCVLFANEYKRKCALRMRLKTGEVKGLKGVEIQVNEIDSKEYLENVIAYVLRNPLAAGINIMPYYYRWSSAVLYFNKTEEQVDEKLNEMSERKRQRILKSCLSVSDNYVVDGHGMILPVCYVDYAEVERIFGHPSRLMMQIARKIETDVEIRMGVADQVVMTDQEILTQMKILLRSEFGKESIEQLSMEQRIKLCRLLKRNFRAGVKQIARLTRIGVDVVSKVV